MAKYTLQEQLLNACNQLATFYISQVVPKGGLQQAAGNIKSYDPFRAVRISELTKVDSSTIVNELQGQIASLNEAIADQAQAQTQANTATAAHAA